MLMFAGVPSAFANASSTVVLLPGAATSAWVYRADYRGFGHISMQAMVGIDLVGGLLGALLLINISSRAPDSVVSWSLLIGPLAPTFGKQAGVWLRRRVQAGWTALLIAQGALVIYGGYFGGAIGIMMMVVWALPGHDDIEAPNASRTLLVGVANLVVVACLALVRMVWWPQTLVMLVVAALGGYMGAHVGKRLPVPAVRVLISTFGSLMTVLLFWRVWLHV